MEFSLKKNLERCMHLLTPDGQTNGQTTRLHNASGRRQKNLIRSSPYSWVTSQKELERSNNYFSSYRANKNFFFLVKKMPAAAEWLFEFNLLHHVCVVAKRLRAAAETTHKGDDNTPSRPMG